MESVSAVAAYTAATLLLIAGVAKILGHSFPNDALQALRVPSSVSRYAAPLLPFVELSLAAAVFMIPGLHFRVALAAFCLGLAVISTYLVTSHPEVECRCFGILEGSQGGSTWLSAFRSYICSIVALVGCAAGYKHSYEAIVCGLVLGTGLTLAFALLDKASMTIRFSSVGAR